MEKIEEIRKDGKVVAFGTDKVGKVKFGRKPIRTKRQPCSGKCSECFSVLC